MMRIACSIFAVLAVAIVACTPEPTLPPQPAPVAVAPVESPDADKEVLVATEPSGAKVFLKGAEVGTTPMKLLVRGNTNVVLEKEGYVKQALMITPESEPNLVVTLEPSGEGEGEAEVEDEPSVGPSAVAKKGKGKKGKGEAEPAEAEAEAETAPAETAPAEEQPALKKPTGPPPDTTPKKKNYSNMKQIKRALALGEITHAEAKQWQHKFKQMRAAEYAKVKQDYENDKITKAEYKQKIAAIKAKYEG